MADFTLPELGENVSTGDVLRVLVKAGDTLAIEQPVLELETDKATIEVPSSVAGTVGDVKVKPGDKVKVGQVILTVAEAAGGKAGGQEGGKAEIQGRKAEGQEGKAARQEGKAGRQEGKDEAQEGNDEAPEGRPDETGDAVGANTAEKIPDEDAW